ncbi:DUF4132 domain-containing protein [Nocardioides litoris]|uniref:DUF4132 domain-containing protein n=1 Tax=Nocardioides litoris TaxID=1926648 RepID=UPI0011227AD2|nr:DUF4132 domain-containing protein [Nocardioides litoris]
MTPLEGLAAHHAPTREAAARALAAEPTTGADRDEVVAALARLARVEREETVLSAVLDALASYGERPVDHLDRPRLDAAAARAAGRALPAALAWLDVDALPVLTWSDTGAEVPRATVRSWVQQAVRARSTAPGAVLRTLLAAVEPGGRTELGRFLLHGWLSAGAPGAARWVVAVVVPGDDDEVVGLAADHVRTRAKAQPAQAAALLALLARAEQPLALEVLVEAAEGAPVTSVRTAAIAAVDDVAERRGWTAEQVGDRGAPTGGFDATGRLRLDYGPRGFTAVLQPDLTVRVVPDEGGAERTSLPPARAADDAGRVREAKAVLAAAKKTVGAAARSQAARLRQAMATQRGWTVADWHTDVAGHPVLGRLAAGLVWWVGDPATSFRPLDDGSLTDVDDEPVDLDPHAAAGDLVRLAHDVLLPPDLVEAWRSHLADYEAVVPFTQLGEPLPAHDPEATGLTDVAGTEVSAGGLHRLAERLGFRRLVGDGGVVAAYARELGDGVGAVLAVRGGSWVGDWSATVELGPLLLAGPDGPVTLGSLPPVLLAELHRDLLTLGSG